jgi:ABC-type uncharacterized transport system substrate-binding protein
MKRRLRDHWAMALFFLSLGLYLVTGAMQRPRILVVHSYATDYSWTRAIDRSIRQVFEDQSFSVRHHFMDTKKHSDEEFKEVAGALVRNKIDEWDPHVLILVDDNAQSLVGVCYANPAGRDVAHLHGLDNAAARDLFGRCYSDHPRMQILFAGIGASAADYGYDGQANISGIEERIDIAALREFFEYYRVSHALPLLRVLAPLDNSMSAHYNREALVRLGREMGDAGIRLETRVVASFDQWREVIAEGNERADLLLFSNYHTVHCGQDQSSLPIAPGRLIDWTNLNSEIPGIGAWGFYTEDGGMMSLAVSPREQGETVARMAVRILKEGRRAGSMAVTQTRQSEVFQREWLLRHHAVTLPRIYRTFALATGHHFACADHECAGELARWRARRAAPRVSPCDSTATP